MKKLILIALIVVLISSFGFAAIQDDFDRADSSTLGVATNGNTWVQAAPNCWEIYDDTIRSQGCTTYISAELEFTAPSPTNISFDVTFTEDCVGTKASYANLKNGAGSTGLFLTFCYDGEAKFYSSGWNSFDTPFIHQTDTTYHIDYVCDTSATDYCEIWIDGVMHESSAGFYNQITIEEMSFRAAAGIEVAFDCLTTEGDVCSGGDTPPVVSNAQLIASDDPINSSNANLISSWDYSDAENESMIANQTIWYKDSVEQPSLENQSTISNTDTAVGESWQFKTRAQASNLVWSVYEFSNSLVILNNAPVMSALEIGAVPLYTSVNATAEAIYTDSETDVGTVNFEWFINNVSSYSVNITGVSSGSKAESQLNFGLYNEGDVIYFKTFGTDGINDSAIKTSSSLTVQETPVVATDGEVFNYLAILMGVLILALSIAICCIEDKFVKMMLLIPLNLIVLSAVHLGKLIVEGAYSSLTSVVTILDALFICLAVLIIPLTVIMFCYIMYQIIDSIFNSRKKRDKDWEKWQD